MYIYRSDETATKGSDSSKYQSTTCSLLNLSSLAITTSVIVPTPYSYANFIPNVAKAQAFGHPGYVFIPPAKRVKGDKFAPRAQRGHLVGMKGEGIYEMWIPETEKVITTASVKFDKYGEQSETTPPPPTDNTEQGLEAENTSRGHAPIAPIVREMRRASSQAPLLPTVEEVAEDEAYDGDAFQLPEAGGGHGFDGLQPDPLWPTRGNNRALRQQDISADLNKAHIIEGKRTRQQGGARAHFTSTTFDRCSRWLSSSRLWA
jgi:hypothetical protein